MAYYDQRSGSSERAVAAGLVAVLQVGVMVALVHGLAVVFIPRETPLPPPTGEQIYLPPPPPTPKPQPSDHPSLDKTSTRDVTDSPVRSARNDTDVKLPPVGPAMDDGAVIDHRPPPPPPPSGLERGARATNRPGSWVTQDDYSPSDIRSERQGMARFTLGIGTDGKVTSCTILQSTGYESLDAATCKLVSRRARFDAALDDSGAPITSSYTGSIRWVIPE